MMLHEPFFGFRFHAESNAPAEPRQAAAPEARAVTLTVPAAPETVFNFLADVENLPRWAAGFCERLEISAGRWTALTSFGDLWIEIAADARNGAIDLLAAEDAGRMEPLFAVRIFSAPDGGSRVRFTFHARAGDDAESRERHYRDFLLDLRGLLVRFGGGELEAGTPSPDLRREGSGGEHPEMGDPVSSRAWLRPPRHSWSGVEAGLFEQLRLGSESRPRRDHRTVSR